MNTTTNQGAGGSAEGGSGAGNVADTASPATTTSGTAAPAPAASAPAAAAPAKPVSIGSAAQNALNAASAKRAARAQGAAAAPGKTNPAPPQPGQAAVSPGKSGAEGAGQANGASTQGGGEGTTQQGATGAEAGTAGTGSTEAPKDWPQDVRERFAKLPDEGRALLLEQYKDMRAGLTRANESLARERDQLGVLSQTMREHRVEPAQVSELVSLSARFEAEPQAVIQQLAQQKGLKVHFGDAAASVATGEGDVPEFKSTAELVAFVEQRALSRIRGEQEAAKKTHDATAARDARLTELRAQYSDAKREIADFGTHEQGVMDTLQKLPNLSVQQAYRLASYEGLQQTAAKVPALEAEIAALKGDIDKARKQATAPARAQVPNTDPAKSDVGRSPAQKALERAQRTIAARGARH